jgi:hypothetical protein
MFLLMISLINGRFRLTLFYKSIIFTSFYINLFILHLFRL